jgi:hypothetical protein
VTGFGMIQELFTTGFVGSINQRRRTYELLPRYEYFYTEWEKQE